MARNRVSGAGRSKPSPMQEPVATASSGGLTWVGLEPGKGGGASFGADPAAKRDRIMARAPRR